MTIYRFTTKVKSVEMVKRVRRGWKNPDGSAETEEEELGWFVCLEGSWEKLYLGQEKPLDIAPGDIAKVAISFSKAQKE